MSPRMQAILRNEAWRQADRDIGLKFQTQRLLVFVGAFAFMFLWMWATVSIWRPFAAEDLKYGGWMLIPFVAYAPFLIWALGRIDREAKAAYEATVGSLLNKWMIEELNISPEGQMDQIGSIRDKEES